MILKLRNKVTLHRQDWLVKVRRQSNFADLYAYAFHYCLTEEKQKNIDIETICQLLEIVMDHSQSILIFYIFMSRLLYSTISSSHDWFCVCWQKIKNDYKHGSMNGFLQVLQCLWHKRRKWKYLDTRLWEDWWCLCPWAARLVTASPPCQQAVQVQNP